MSETGRFVLATLCGLVLAALVHIGIVFGIPWLGERDAFSRLRSTVAAERSELVAGPGATDTWPPRPDPAPRPRLAGVALALDGATTS